MVSAAIEKFGAMGCTEPFPGGWLCGACLDRGMLATDGAVYDANVGLLTANDQCVSWMNEHSCTPVYALGTRTFDAPKERQYAWRATTALHGREPLSLFDGDEGGWRLLCAR